MKIIEILDFPNKKLPGLTKDKLIEMHITLKKEFNVIKAKLEAKNEELEKTISRNINDKVNQPSSKQAEFNKGTGHKGKKKQSKKRQGRKRTGNRSKPTPETINHNRLTNCPECNTNLTTQPVLETTSRIVEDIISTPEKTIVVEEVQERKWCSSCCKIVTSRTEAALPRSDIGIRATCLIAYLWVVSAISLPVIKVFLESFFRLSLSTAGISRMMIRLGNIMSPVYEEILEDVKGGAIIFADETGWRVKGVLWWLWIFANKRAAYYWPDRRRGSEVVEKILGAVFSGILITDAWHAYLKIVCVKQSCVAHILRKIRKFRDAYPQYYSIFIFYNKLRRILIDGEQLQASRKELGEESFWHKTKLLNGRLNKLLLWKNPNRILKEIIAKVARQSDKILTFIEHEGAPNHNNYAEYIIKKGILKRKVSGGSMSEEGFRSYAIIQSIAQTRHLRGISFISFLNSSLINYIRTGTTLLLSQYEQQLANKIKEAA